MQIPGRRGSYRADVLSFDARNDVAVLRVRGARLRRRSASPTRRPDTPVAILGYPENGPLTAIPGRIGRTAIVLTRDAYGHGPVPRTITAVAGRVRHGNSGGPAVDAAGAVAVDDLRQARSARRAASACPTSLVARALDGGQRPVSTGDCARLESSGSSSTTFIGCLNGAIT